MHLVIDASVAVAQALRTSGRLLLRHPALQIFASVQVMNETTYELRRRVEQMVSRGHLSTGPAAALLSDAQRTVTDSVASVPEHAFDDRLGEAAWRIPRDPNDAQTLALALALDCGIWTSDRDFFGCGLPVWSTEVLQTQLEHLQDIPNSDGVSR